MLARVPLSIRKAFSIEALLLIILSAAIFLPYAFQLTYYLDDWYFVYNEVVRGPNVFHEMFSVDRPARGYFFDIFFSVFGANPLPHHLGTFAWRLGAGLSAFWLLNLLWVENRRVNFLASLLLIFYPGYSWWVTIEYQPIAASLTLQIFSVLFTLLSIHAENLPQKLVLALAALATGFAYPALVEYAVGAEMFRLFCIFLYISHELPDRFWMRAGKSLKVWLPYTASALGFAFWRVFIFESSRKATDVSLFTGGFASAPLASLRDMGNRLYISIINAGVSAWYKPLLSRAGELSWNLPPQSLALILILGIAFALIGFLWNRRGVFAEPAFPRTMPREAVVLGLISLVVGVLPVVFFGRFINLSVYSHYGLPISLACVILLAGLITLLPSNRLQFAVFSIFVLAAALNHSLLAEKTLTLERSLASFWWQASWRVPGLRPDTTLVTTYPYPNIVDGDLGLPEAANLIYFPEPRDEHPLRYPVSAIMPTDKNIENILSGKRGKTESYRTFKMVIRYDNILVVVQPSPASCVRVVDGDNFVPSEMDSKSIRQISKFSKINNVRLIESQNPPAYAFGEEPAHGWCYYFEKANLALQEEDWELAAQYGDETFALGLSPSDLVEWYPFIQAYAMTGDAEKLDLILAQAESNTFIKNHLCERMRSNNHIFPLNEEIRELIEGYSCN